jgi:DNA polymerase-3 subunit alpha
VRSGAFDALEPNRARLLAGLDTMVAYANIAAEARESQQTSLFGGDGAGGLARPDLAVVPDWPPAERLKQEFDAVGFFLSSHPLEEYSAILKRLRVILHGELAAKLATVGGVVRARLAGAVVARQDRRSQRGNPYAFVRLTDPSGEYEATVFAEVLSASRELLQVGRSVVLTIDAELVEDQPKLRVQGVEALEPLAAEAAAGLRILLGDPLDVAPLQASLPKGGKGAVSLLVMADRGQHEVEIQLPGGYRVTPDVRAALKAVPGVLAVEEV